MRELVVVEGDDIHGSVGFDVGVIRGGDVAAIFHPHSCGSVFAEKAFIEDVGHLSALLGAVGKIDSIEQSEFMHWSVCSAFMD